MNAAAVIIVLAVIAFGLIFGPAFVSLWCHDKSSG